MHWRGSNRPIAAVRHTPAVSDESSKTTRKPDKMFTAAVHRFEEAIGWPIDTFIKHFEHRLFETSMALSQIAIGVLLMLSPRSVGTSGMRYLVYYIPAELVMVTFLLVGIARMVALVLNGHWKPGGAYTRSIGAALGALLWTVWAAAFCQINIVEGVPLAPVIALLGVLVFFEVVSMYRALLGVKNNGKVGN